MTRIFSPNNIGVLLHYYTRGFTPHPRLGASAVNDAIGTFVTLGCLRAGDSPGCYETTARGKAWVEALLRVECLREAFIDGYGVILGYAEVDK